MPHRTLTTLLAILATTGAGAALADAAQATPVGTLRGVVLDDDALISLGQDPEVSLTDGNVAFAWGYAKVTPRVTGQLHMVDGDDACFRVRADSFDAAGTLVGSAYDKEAGHCRHSDALKDVPVDMQAVGGPTVRRVQVALEKQATGDRWKTKITTLPALLTTFADDVTVLGGGIDVGGEDWVNGAPTAAAKVTWAVGDDGKMTATYSGYLHLKGFYPGSGRVVIRAIDPVTGFRIGTTEGDAHTPADNGHHGYQDTLSVTTSNGANLQVAMQSLVTDPATGTASWQDVGTQTVTASE